MDSDLPPLYERWMLEALPGPIPRETLAPCLDCAMCPKSGAARTAEDVAFHPTTKCCTYVPDIPNYLVGRILAEPDPAMAEGRSSVERRIDGGLGVTPLGLGVSKADRATYRKITEENRFGREPAFRCPHYIDRDGGLCGVWKHRAAVCATWFCRYVRGDVGRTFWKAIERYLRWVEDTLSDWAVLELGLEPEAMKLLYRIYANDPNEEVELTAEVRTRKRLWGAWWGREREFYRESARLVDGLSWAKIRGLGGATLEVRYRILMDCWNRLLAADVPPAVHAGRFFSASLDSGEMRFWSYSRYHPIDLPASFVMALMMARGGGSVEEVAKSIRAQTGIEADGAFLRKLLDVGLLVPHDVEAAEPERRGGGFFG